MGSYIATTQTSIGSEKPSVYYWANEAGGVDVLLIAKTPLARALQAEIHGAPIDLLIDDEVGFRFIRLLSSANGEWTYVPEFAFNVAPVGLSVGVARSIQDVQPNDVQLSPNPVPGVALIEFDQPVSMPTRISVFDMQGREVRLLEEKVVPQGRHHMPFNSSGLANGLYFLRIQTGSYVRSHPIIVRR